MRQEYVFSSLLFNMVLEALAGAVREEKKNKEIQIGKYEVYLPLFADSLILYMKEVPKFSPENFYK